MIRISEESVCSSKMGQELMKMKKKMDEVKFDTKEKYFIRNGGILLEKQIALSQGQDMGSGQLKIFSAEEVAKATNCCDPNLITGRIRSTVYKATLEDRIVAIKVPVHLMPDLGLLDLFLTEASAGIVMSHNNIVKLYGCCLETCLPILVYEFLPNGTLFRHLHGTVALSKSLEWSDHLRIATEVSYALSYMHTALPQPLVHRDVQSLSVLLDMSFQAKLSNFGLSVSITPGEKPQKWPVRGTPGYIDPEYIETKEVTEKCDVYGFGVLMLELLTGRHPTIFIEREGIDLDDVVVSAGGRNFTMKMVDMKVLEQGRMEQIDRFIQLALKCVAKRGVERPTMIEVVSELWLIQGRERKSVDSKSQGIISQSDFCCSSDLAKADA